MGFNSSIKDVLVCTERRSTFTGVVVFFSDRAHVDDVEKELEVYVEHLEGYINALKAEIKCRISNISVLKQANTHLEKDKKDVKVVANVNSKQVLL